LGLLFGRVVGCGHWLSRFTGGSMPRAV
jgi:hypothetical protein